MSENNKKMIVNKIQDKIFDVRGRQVMLDFDLAELYNVPVKRLNEQVKRNINRFPEKFMFQLTESEFPLRSQFATSKNRGGRRYLPYAFTEQGVSMLSTVLRSDIAVEVSIKIIDAFVNMRKFFLNNAEIFSRLVNVEQEQIKTNKKVDRIFNAIEDRSIKPKQGIFYNGQIFDAYIFVSKIVKSANKEIIIIDNYVDETVLQLLIKRKKNVKVAVYAKKITRILKQDLDKYNQQYQDKKIEIKTFKKSHDRFIIVDNKMIYHFGASLKDLGKKWFAFSKLEIDVKSILNNLDEK